LNIKVSREDLLKQLGYKDPPQPRLLDMVLEMLGLLGGLVERDWPSKKSKRRTNFRPFSAERALKYAGAGTLGPKLENQSQRPL